MELGLKAWILVGGAVVILAVLAHGLWLSRQRSRQALRMDLDRGVGRDDNPSPFSAELPGGGKARVVGDEPFESADTAAPRPERPSIGGRPHASAQPRAVLEPEPTQQRLPNMDDPVPVLLEAVDGEPDVVSAARSHDFRGVDDAGAGDAGVIRAEQPSARQATGEIPIVRKPRSPRPEQHTVVTMDDAADEPLGDPDEILTFAVVSRGGEGFPGAELLRFVTDRGLSYGDMNIFHYTIGQRVQYSMANLVEPGTFDLAAIEDTRLKGVTFFMRLPGPDQPLEALDHMVGVLRGLAERFDGDLLDSERSVLTRQGIEHTRDLVRGYTRRRMTRQA